VLLNMEEPIREVIKAKTTDLFPKREERAVCAGAIGRGSIVGFMLGLIPGINSMIPTFLAYALEKAVSKHPERFGTGVIEGVAAPETANNAYANAAMIPMLTLGIPGSATLAVLIGAFTIHGLAPGPLLFQQRPDVAWGLIASLYVGNIMLLILNLPLVGMWAKLLQIRDEYLYPGVLLFCVIGSYSLNGSVFDVGVMVVFGVLGYILRKIDWPLAPIVLALILAPTMEKNLRFSVEMSDGDLTIFLTRPISAVLLLLAVIVLVTPAFRLLGQKAGKDDGN